mmetsp:Transcript_91759/g.262339  ORF Transcript_91759/g.262339 Transcript_91759/m.262339 type:complete len:205 (-) Transcript_91759:703-1317(-)
METHRDGYQQHARSNHHAAGRVDNGALDLRRSFLWGMVGGHGQQHRSGECGRHLRIVVGEQVQRYRGGSRGRLRRRGSIAALIAQAQSSSAARHAALSAPPAPSAIQERRRRRRLLWEPFWHGRHHRGRERAPARPSVPRRTFGLTNDRRPIYQGCRARRCLGDAGRESNGHVARARPLCHHRERRSLGRLFERGGLPPCLPRA